MMGTDLHSRTVNQGAENPPRVVLQPGRAVVGDPMTARSDRQDQSRATDRQEGSRAAPAARTPSKIPGLSHSAMILSAHSTIDTKIAGLPYFAP